MSRFRPSSFHRFTATVLIGVLGLGYALSAPAFAQEKGHGAIHGDILGADERTAIAGARVTAVNVMSGKQYTSDVTRENGSYEITGLPAGTYDIVIELEGNVFVADHIVDLGPGESKSLPYSVDPQRPANRIVAGMKPPAGSAQIIGQASVAPNFWTSPAGLILLGVVSGGVGYAITHNNKKENHGSSSTP